MILKHKIAFLIEGIVLVLVRYRLIFAALVVALFAVATYAIFSDPVVAASVRAFTLKTVPKYARLVLDLMVRACAKREVNRALVLFGSWTLGAWVRRQFRKGRVRIQVIQTCVATWWRTVPRSVRWIIIGISVVIPAAVVLFLLFGWLAVIFIPWDLTRQLWRYLIERVLVAFGFGQLARQFRPIDRLAQWLVPEEWRLIYRQAMRRYAKRVIRRRRIAARRSLAHAASVRVHWMERRVRLTERLVERRAHALTRRSRVYTQYVWREKFMPALLPWCGRNTSALARMWTRKSE